MSDYRNGNKPLHSWMPTFIEGGVQHSECRYCGLMRKHHPEAPNFPHGFSLYRRWQHAQWKYSPRLPHPCVNRQKVAA